MGRKSDAKERILSGALKLIHERGYANVSVDDIMQSAGVGKSSFYHFFKSKEVLGEAVIAEYGRRLDAEILQKAFSPGFDPLDRPIRFLSMLIDTETEQEAVLGCLAGNSAVENSTISERLRLKTVQVLEMIRIKFEDAFSDAVEEMDLLPDTPVDLLAEASLAYIEGLLLLSKAKQSVEPLRRLGPDISHLWKPYAV